MKTTGVHFLLLFCGLACLLSCNTTGGSQNIRADAVRLSQNLLYAVKLQSGYDSLKDSLAKLSMQSLEKSLRDDDSKKTFWVNIYNAYTQILLENEAYQSSNKEEFFKAKKIEINGASLSLDDIEHYLLRKESTEDLFLKKFQLSRTDPRVHFALNCGAKSCPLIRFYETKKINNQLDLAARIYLEAETELDTAANTVAVPAVMNWFLEDFGGEEGILRFLKEYEIIPKDAFPQVKFREFDWTILKKNINF